MPGDFASEAPRIKYSEYDALISETNFRNTQYNKGFLSQACLTTDKLLYKGPAC